MAAGDTSAAFVFKESVLKFEFDVDAPLGLEIDSDLEVISVGHTHKTQIKPQADHINPALARP